MSLWDEIRSWFVSNRQQILSVPLPDPHAEATLEPEESYFGLWLSQSFLKRDRAWLERYYPAAHVSVRLDVAGETRTLTRLAQPAAGMVGAGVWTDFPVTGLLPYNGGTVEVEAGLSALTTSSLLGAAVGMIQDFSGLLVPPVSEALAVADKVATGIQGLLNACDGEVFLATHHSYNAPGGGGENTFAPGYFAVIGATEAELKPADLLVENSTLRIRTPQGSRPLEGFNYLLFRIEGRHERDDWRFPQIEALIRRAKEAFFAGEERAFARYRDDALVMAITSPDLTRPDRKRVALAIRDELTEATSAGPGVTAGPSRLLPEIMETHGVPLQDPRLNADLTLGDLVNDRI